MGITIHFSGTIDDLQRVEEMEDRVTDLVFALGGKATIWRSYAEHDPSRVVRGLLVDMAPGQETLSLLLSPEGHLTPLFQIEDAEKQPFHEPPYCSVKTQFGSIQGHVAVVFLLDALKECFFSNMKITDESGYAENRDIGDLKHKQEFLAGAIQSLADGLNQHGLSPEAAEDPNIVALRIERVTASDHTSRRHPGSGIPDATHETGFRSINARFLSFSRLSRCRRHHGRPGASNRRRI